MIIMIQQHRFTLFLITLFLIGSYPLIAQSEGDSSITQKVDNATPCEISSTQSMTRIITVDVDVQTAPKDEHALIASPIIISLATDTLKLNVHSTIYPNIYLDSIESFLGDSSCSNYFKQIPVDPAAAAILLIPEADPGKISDTFIPTERGSVTLEFYGDLVVEKGKWLQKQQKIRHVTVQVPVTVV